MLAPTTQRVRVEEYYRMAITGELPRKGVELLDGKIIPMSPIGPFHGSVVDYLADQFSGSCNRRWIMRVQGSLRMNDFSEPQPDIILLKRTKDFYARHQPTSTDVYLLIEVCDTTLEFDVEEKLPAYGRAGVPEVWLVNLNELSIEVYRQPQATGYASKTVLRAGEQAHPTAFADVSIDVAELFQR